MARNQRQRRTDKADAGQIVPYDDERARVWKIRQQRLYMAIDALVRGMTPSQLCTTFALYAEATGDNHKLWNVKVNAARIIMDDARKELNKNLAKDRAGAYSTQMARYEMLYREALNRRVTCDICEGTGVVIRRDETEDDCRRCEGKGTVGIPDMRQAHAVLNSITELQERISGAAGNGQQESRKAGHTGSKIGEAVDALTRAIARSNRSRRKATQATGDEPDRKSVV